MRSYIVFQRLLGGEWETKKVDGKTPEYLDLAVAMGIAETLKSPIIETQIASVDTDVFYDDDGKRHVRKVYELV